MSDCVFVLKAMTFVYILPVFSLKGYQPGNSTANVNNSYYFYYKQTWTGTNKQTNKAKWNWIENKKMGKGERVVF